jgi:GT2 family glycosyltransferase/2-polyprenyl-3-methyl-5-hydroxy-6-metoxy-1,4-benzoquinol methylase
MKNQTSPRRLSPRSSQAFKYDFTVDLENKNLAHTLMIELVGTNKQVLDVGCATGYLDRVFQERGCSVTGIEINKEAARAARQYCGRVLTIDVEQLNWKRAFRNLRFDVILFGDVLEHLKDPRKILVTARDFLAPEGYLVASIPNVAHASLKLHLLAGEFRYRPLGLLDESHLRFFTFDTIKAMFDEAGYVIDDVRRVKLGAFETEIALEPQSFPPEVLDFALKDAESLTYQFVIRAHPRTEEVISASHLLIEKEAQSASAQKEIQDLRSRNERLEGELHSQRKLLDQQDATLAATREQVQQLARQCDLLLAERRQLEVGQLRQKIASSRFMPGVDIVTVTYNSARFLPGFFQSVNRLQYPKAKLTLTTIDNASFDGTEKLALQISTHLGIPVRKIRLAKNIGFAGGANVGIRAGTADFICLANPDTEFYSDALTELVDVATQDPFIAIVDARQLPFEHPKKYDPSTRDTSWCSGAGCLIRRSAINKVGLFDEKFFMYCEDVDLSWRLWSAGYRCAYAPKARLVHHKKPEDYRPDVDYFYGVRNGIVMRLVYGSFADISQHYRNLLRELLGSQTDPILRSYLWRAMISHLRFLPHAFLRRMRLFRNNSSWIKFCGWNYGEHRW